MVPLNGSPVYRLLMDSKQVAHILAELGNETRLSVFQLLVQAGGQGLTVGEVQQSLGIPASTLAFHLRSLSLVNLVEQVRHGRSVICKPRLDVLNKAVEFIQRECCKGVPARRIARAAQ